jgi:SAM-dependent methyltransferase
VFVIVHQEANASRYGQFFHRARQGEWDRLYTLSESFDPYTQARLLELPVPERATILEVGPGAGTVAEWLRNTYHPAELVLLDRDADLLAYLEPIATRTVLADLTEIADAPGAFDLIHVRNLLFHLPERRSVVTRLASWLRPGGWLVVSDALDASCLTGDPWAADAGRLLRRSAEAVVGSDFTWAMTFPEPLREAGLDQVGVGVDVPPLASDGAMARFLDLSMRALVATADAQGHDIGDRDEIQRTLDGALPPGAVAISPVAQATAWGHKPR